MMKLLKVSTSVVLLLSLARLARAEPALELRAEEVVPKLGDFRVQESGGEAYVLTGIPREDRARATVAYMAISRVNPVSAPETAASRALFGTEARRPLTWREAEAGCQAFKLAGKEWRLPTATEATQMNGFLRFKETILDQGTGPARRIAGDFGELAEKYPGLSFFWLSERNETLGAGLKLAATYGAKDGSIQSLSMHRPLNVVCVTYFSGPPSPVVVAARQSADKAAAATNH